MNANSKGALWMLASAFAFALAMTLVKLLGDYSSAQQNFLRQCVGLVVLAPLILKNPKSAFTLRRPWYMLSRAAATTASIILAYNSYHALGLAEANALSFTRTLYMVPLAALLLREKVDAHRVAATLIGFGGVLVILSPGSGRSLIGWPAAQGLLAALLVSWSIIGVKSMSRDHSTLSLLTWSVLLGIVFTAPLAALSWRSPQGMDLLLLVLMGVLNLVTQSCYIRGMSLGEASLMAPLDYVRIIFSTIMGLAFFGDIPAWSTFLGAAIIIVAALYVTLHGRRQEAKRLVDDPAT